MYNDDVDTPVTNTLFGAFFLALDRLQQLHSKDGAEVEDGTGVREGVAMAEPTAVEYVLWHWTLGDPQSLQNAMRSLQQIFMEQN